MPESLFAPEAPTATTAAPKRAAAVDEKHRKFLDLLKELFQFDAADLDFGIYRVLNLKRAEITKFLDQDLLPQVDAAFARYQPKERMDLEREVATLTRQLTEAGVDPATSPKLAEKRAQLAKAPDVSSMQARVFDHLYEFFSRYYDEGDFISQRRYVRAGESQYLIPYNGEEVALHWANKDQYYVKSGDRHTNYAFFVNTGEGKRRVRFVLVRAEADKGDTKTDDAKKRRFQLATKDHGFKEAWLNVVDPAATLESDSPEPQPPELEVRFVYAVEPDAKKASKQDKLTAEIEQLILAHKVGKTDQAAFLTSILAALSAKDPTHNVDKESDRRTILAKHLRTYTKKNTADYFIHKDLGGFLRRELDLFIKTEVLSLDDLSRVGEVGPAELAQRDDVEHLERLLNEARAVRAVADKIITLLAGIEDFQKRLWLKRRFILDTRFLISLDRVPQHFYDEIGTNKSQIRRWAELFGIDERRGYNRDKLSSKFLAEHPGLILDTIHFAEDFNARLLAQVQDIDEALIGTCFNGDNAAVLRLIGPGYQARVDCVYIDPPYNAKTSEIAYKNTYKHSSWLCMMNERLALSHSMSTDRGATIIAIDENEHDKMAEMIRQSFPDTSKVSVSVVHNPRGIQGDNFSFSHEYAVFITPAGMKLIRPRPLPKEKWEFGNLRNWGGESLRTDAKNCFYKITAKNGRIVEVGEAVLDDDFHPKAAWERKRDGTVEIWPIDAGGVERKWRYSATSLPEELERTRVVEIDGEYQVQIASATEPWRTVWVDPRYDAGTHGTKLLNEMVKGSFSFPKSVHLVADCLEAILGGTSRALILDYFGGSGTTGHAVLNARRNGRDWRFVLAELNEYFDDVLVPRIQKAAYAPTWRDQKPTLHTKSISICVKVHRVEMYEDALANIESKQRPDAVSALVSSSPEFRESHALRYLADEGLSDSRLDVRAFRRPFDVRAAVEIGGEQIIEKVDLVWTFNYLLGLRVQTMDRVRVPLKGPGENDPSIRVVTGKDPAGRKVLILWRDVDRVDNETLEAWVRKQKYNPLDSEFDLIYVNGDHTLENIRPDGQTWKVRLIEEDFTKLMFDVEDV